MSQYENYAPYATGADTLEITNTLFRKVYQYMAFGLILTSFFAWFSVSNASMVKFLFSSQVPMIVLCIIELGLVFGLGMAISKISAGTALLLFLLYSVINGMTCSVLLLVYTSESVYKAFLSTAGMFGVMSLYGLYTKRDLTGMGSFLRMGLFGLIIAMVINIFVGSSMAEFYISIFGVIIFMGLTAYDTAKIKQLSLSLNGADDQAMGKVAVIGALELYLDFINLFIYLLRIFGRKRD
ncbi:MAG: Bax inhibitor-1/YccA family protein [Synergistaceae bacterium]|nr:Bax inhibitor-1/YccA family protein [Synergistaceae bacterium]